MSDLNAEPTWEMHPGYAIISLPDGFVSKTLFTKAQALACVLGLYLAKRIDGYWALEYRQFIDLSELPDTTSGIRFDPRLYAKWN